MRARILTQRLGRDPTAEELAVETEFPAKRVTELLELVEDPVSLETPVGEGDSLYGDLLEDTNSALPEVVTAERLRQVEISEALAKLNPRMRR